MACKNEMRTFMFQMSKVVHGSTCTPYPWYLLHQRKLYWIAIRER